MGAQHQRQRTVAACFFVCQNFSRLVFRLFEFAFKESLPRIIKRGGSLTAFTGGTETLHSAGYVQQTGYQADKEIQNHDGNYQAQYERVQVHTQHGLSRHHIHITGIDARSKGQPDGHGKQNHYPNDASHA